MVHHILKGYISNRPTGGGNKLQGLPPRTNKPVGFILNSINRRSGKMVNNKIFLRNTLGKQMFGPTADGISDNIREYSLSVSTNFKSGNWDNILFSGNKQFNVFLNPEGDGQDDSGGFISSSGKYATDYYIHFGTTDPNSAHVHNSHDGKFKPIMEYIDVNAPSWEPDNIKSRYLMSNTIPSIINKFNNQHQGGVLQNFKIENIVVSFIAGDSQNGGDKPDMHTGIKHGMLTAPENLYLEFFDTQYNKVGERVDIWQTKEPLSDASMGDLVDGSGAKFRWQGYNFFRDNYPNMKPPPYPNGTPFVSGQGFSTADICFNTTITNLPVQNPLQQNKTLIQTLSDTNGIFYNSNLQIPYTWDGTSTFGPYKKDLITYSKGKDFTDDFIYQCPENITMKNNVVGFRIFQDRYAHPQDEYGVRYVKMNLKYTCYHPQFYMSKD